MTLNEVARCLDNNDSSFIGCVLDANDAADFYPRDNGNRCSCDWYEGEGADELVIDANNVILYFDGYYFGMGID